MVLSTATDRLLAEKLADPQMELNEEESIALLNHCVMQGEKNAQRIEGKDMTIVMGNTGAGKSTFVNWLGGCQMECKSPQEAKELYDVAVMKPVVVVKEGSKPAAVMPIGHAKKSKTFLPQVANGICDCPGFVDNRGAEINIANAVNIRMALEAAMSVRIVVLVDYNSLGINRDAGISDMLEICTHLFGSQEAMMAHKNSLLIGITKAPPDAELPSVVNYIVDGAPETMRDLADRVFLYDPLDKGNKSFWDRCTCQKKLRELKAIPQDKSDKLFKTVLSDSDVMELLQLVRKQGESFRKHLLYRQYEQASRCWSNLNRLRIIDHDEVKQMLTEDQQKVQAMVNIMVSKFRDNCANYRFDGPDEAIKQLDVLKEIDAHFGKFDPPIMDLDIEKQEKYLKSSQDKKKNDKLRAYALAGTTAVLAGMATGGLAGAAALGAAAAEAGGAAFVAAETAAASNVVAATIGAGATALANVVLRRKLWNKEEKEGKPP